MFQITTLNQVPHFPKYNRPCVYKAPTIFRQEFWEKTKVPCIRDHLYF